MPFCANCGSEVGGTFNFCNVCGTATSDTPVVGHPISLERVVVLSFLSFGLYIIYWFYLTWRQYRDHTGNEAYPVWHALAFVIPIYGWFRAHAHMRSYNELIRGAGLGTDIAVGGVVTALIVSVVLDNVALNFTGSWDYEGYSFGSALASAILYSASLLIGLAVLIHAQTNINRYWMSLDNVRLAPARLRVGEVVFSIIGALAWLDTLLSLFSASYRG
ncbi:MAG TPA: hypothetical protein DCE26_03110 [Dehalococcoidia bacterium]|nr:hypothetical protein [Dehalococcoidia bacterium]|tara:strand:+ start:198 stop:851 length:654 start_codon:yes stop_codon:yes gene_type:complete